MSALVRVSDGFCFSWALLNISPSCDCRGKGRNTVVMFGFWKVKRKEMVKK